MAHKRHFIVDPIKLLGAGDISSKEAINFAQYLPSAICCWDQTAGRGGNDTADAIKLQICGNIGIGSATGASERQGRDLYTYFIGIATASVLLHGIAIFGPEKINKCYCHRISGLSYSLARENKLTKHVGTQVQEHLALAWWLCLRCQLHNKTTFAQL